MSGIVLRKNPKNGQLEVVSGLRRLEALVEVQGVASVTLSNGEKVKIKDVNGQLTIAD